MADRGSLPVGRHRISAPLFNSSSPVIFWSLHVLLASLSLVFLRIYNGRIRRRDRCLGVYSDSREWRRVCVWLEIRRRCRFDGGFRVWLKVDLGQIFTGGFVGVPVRRCHSLSDQILLCLLLSPISVAQARNFPSRSVGHSWKGEVEVFAGDFFYVWFRTATMALLGSDLFIGSWWLRACAVALLRHSA